MRSKLVIPLKLKLFLPVMIIVITVVVITTLWFVNRSIHSFNDRIISTLELEVQTLKQMFERERILKLEKVQTNLKVARIQFFSKPLVVTDRTMTVEVENQRSNMRHEAVLPVWKHGGKELFGSVEFVDFMEGIVGGSVTVFQRIDSGFVRVSTNIRKSDGQRAVATYIPNNSPVAETVLEGRSYFGRAVVVDKWYTTGYDPILIDNEVSGLLYVGDMEKDMSELKRILNNLTIGKSGYPFVFDKYGTLLIHPSREGEQWGDSLFLSNVLNTTDGTLTFLQDGHSKTAAYSYFEPFELYVAASVFNDIENRELVKNAVSGALMVAVIAIIFLLIFIYRFTTERLYNYLNALERSEAKLATTEEALQQSEKLAHMGQISAGIAHELNNPLGVITMYSGIILDELPADSPVRDDIRMIVEQADRCKNIVGGLLNFARKNKVNAREVDIVKFLSQTLSGVVIPENIRTAIHTDIKDTIVMLDIEQMTQVFTNLEKNAVEAMPEGGELNIQIIGTDREVEVIIADTGTGISEENMGKLFTPFFTTKKVGEGTGLGLPLVYGIVKMHKGRINVISNTDPSKGATGTRFCITLPRII
ncbi:MAG: Cache 3/Cache 2 fusion domain-containing protein [Bacteroidales bacterium]|jgi:signal transduction histidine kinase|nr:Cache 3/Cache 2 fusion domain-containing protein [Bacteroidales bacterium]